MRGSTRSACRVCALLKNTATYDPIAGLYNTLWADWYLPAALPALEKLFFSRVPKEKSVLDVCCGCGHVTAELHQRGYRTTGVDISVELVKIAKKHLPDVTFLVQDVRHLAVDEQFESALSTFDSLNHLLTLEEVTAALRQIRQCLVPGALFVFDVNLEEAYFADLRQWHPTVARDEISLVRGTYDLATGLARTDLIWLLRTGEDEVWKRQTAMVYERCYSEQEIEGALKSAGWSAIEWETSREAGVRAELGFGRVFFSARA